MDLVIITALVVTTVLFVEMCFAGSQLTSSKVCVSCNSVGCAVLSEPCYYVYCTVYRIFFGSTV